VHSSITQLRRCGVGVHHVSPDKEPTYSWWHALPGTTQAVPRAELTALLLVAIHVHDAAVIDFFTDSKMTADTYYKGKKRAKFAANADLWVYLFQLIEQKELLVSVYWMPSHTDTDPKKKKLAPAWMKEWHVKGNSVADKLADQAAAFHAVPELQSQPIIDVLKNLKLIQNRILHVISMFPQRPCNIPIVPKPTLLYKAFTTSTHSLSILASRVVCAKCNASVPIKASYVFDFVESKCCPQDKYISIAIGHQHTHPSHQPVMHERVIICTKCGSTALNKIVNLSNNCAGIDEDRYSYGSVNVRSYNRGEAPLDSPDWPYDKLLPAHVQTLRSIQSQMKGVDPPSFCMPVQDPSDSDGKDPEGLSDVSLHGDTSDWSSSSV